MATLLLVGTVVQRSSHTLNALGVAGLLWLLLSPESLYTPGYQLSFAATFGIVVLLNLARRHSYRWPWLESGATRLVANSLLVSLAAFIATFPVLAWHFGEVSLFGIIANVVVVFLMTCCMGAFFVAILVQPLFVPAAAVAARLSSISLGAIIWIADLSRWIPPLTISAWPPLLTLLYAGFFVGLTTARNDLIRGYLRMALPLIALLVPAILLLARLLAPAECWVLDKDEGQVATYAAPSRPTFILCASHSDLLDTRLLQRTVLPWARRLRRSLRFVVLESPPARDEETRLRQALSTRNLCIVSAPLSKLRTAAPPGFVPCDSDRIRPPSPSIYEGHPLLGRDGAAGTSADCRKQIRVWR